MTTMTSIWQTGTYNLLISEDPEGEPGDLLLAVFAAPVNPDDPAAEEDAPILAQREVLGEQYDGELDAHHFGTFGCGERGLLQPEDLEQVFGARLALHLLLLLHEAVENDFNGTDVEGHPWRTPSVEGAFPMLERVHRLMMELRHRLMY